MSHSSPKATPPYKSALSGNWFTVSLFYELWKDNPSFRRPDDIEPIFSFRSKPGYVDFKTTFVEEGDPTGYMWADKYLGSYDHYLYLMKRDWFQEQVELAKNELHVKLKATALKRITEIAQSSNEGQALAAGKYLAEQGWEKHGRGRPSAADVKGEMKNLVRQLDNTAEDAARIGLKVIEGGK